MILSKNVNNKKCALKLIFFNEKNIENWLWVSADLAKQILLVGKMKQNYMDISKIWVNVFI